MGRRRPQPSRVAVVTGGGSGIGEATCHHLTEHGHRVAIVDIDGDGAERVAKAVEAEGGNAIAVHADVTDRRAVDAAFAATVAALGPVEVLVTSAGICPFTPFADITLDEWNLAIDVNLTGTFLGARAGAARMGEGGRIIVTGSVLGDRPHGLLAAYSASKGGAHALVRALAQELGPRKITANVVALGWFDTGLGAHWRRDENRDKDVVSHTALARWGTAADLPGVYLFLASDASAYVTGTTITVDGGYSLL